MCLLQDRGVHEAIPAGLMSLHRLVFGAGLPEVPGPGQRRRFANLSTCRDSFLGGRYDV